jgi:hypothetical protein
MMHHVHQPSNSGSNAITNASISNGLYSGNSGMQFNQADVEQCIYIGDIKIDGKNKKIEMRINNEWCEVLSDTTRLDIIRKEMAEFWPGALVDLVMKGLL